MIMGVIQLAKKTTIRDIIKECIKGGKGLAEFAEVKTQIVETIIKINEVNTYTILNIFIAPNGRNYLSNYG